MTTKFEHFFERIKKSAECKTDTQLAKFLGLNKSTLSMWKKRESVDYNVLFTKFEHLDIDYNWLIKGPESGLLAAEPGAKYGSVKNILSEVTSDSEKIDMLSSLLVEFHFKLNEIDNDVKKLKKKSV